MHTFVFYSFNHKNKYRISQRLQKAKNALFSMSAQGFHAQGVNPLVSANVYPKVIVLIALYGSMLWSNLTNADITAIFRFQSKPVKQLQGLPISTRSDMEE